MLQTCRRARDLGLRIWVIRPCFAFHASDFVLAAAFPGLCEGRDTRYGVWGLFRAFALVVALLRATGDERRDTAFGASDFGFRACPGMPGGGWNKNYEKNVKKGLTGCR